MRAVVIDTITPAEDITLWQDEGVRKDGQESYMDAPKPVYQKIFVFAAHLHASITQIADSTPV